MTGRYDELDLDRYRASTALELGRQVAEGRLSPVQLTECALAVATSAEPMLNAYASLLGDRARTQAGEREAEVRAGLVRSVLHGVPVAIKDNMPYAGHPTRKGSRTSPDTDATASSPMVERLLDAGTVIIGTTTMPEFGWKGTGISPLTGVTRNPWDPQRNSGGSSAGAGATVASGAVPIATGSDAGGSVRIPASFCGVVGVKPTLSAIPLWPGTVNENLSHAGILTRNVADARAALAITRGPDPRDPQSYQVSARGQAPTRPLRVGVVRSPFRITPETGVAATLASAYAAISRIDAEFGDTELPAQLPRDVFETLWVTGRGLGFQQVAEAHADIMDPGLVRVVSLAQHHQLADYFAAMKTRREFNSAMSRCLTEWDLLVMPTMPITAFGAADEVPEGGELAAPLPWITWTPYTYPFNITGQPAVTIPAGFADGMPVGLQIVGPWGEDDRVLAFAERCAAMLSAAWPTTSAPAPYHHPQRHPQEEGRRDG